MVSRCIRHYPLAVKPRSYPRRSFGWEQSLDTGLENYFSIEMSDIESHPVKPITVTIPMPEEVREVGTREVVTAIEVLSPENKRSGEGRKA